MKIGTWHHGTRAVKQLDLKVPVIGTAYPIPPTFAGEIRVNLTLDKDDPLRCTLTMGFDEAEDFARRLLAEVVAARAGSVSRDKA